MTSLLTSNLNCDIIKMKLEMTSKLNKEVDMGIKTFTLRLNDEQHQYLEEKSKELGVTKNRYIQNLIQNEILIDKQDKILSEIMEIKEMLKNLEK